MREIFKKYYDITLVVGIGLFLTIAMMAGLVEINVPSVQAAASTSTSVDVSATVSEWISLSVTSTSLTLSPNLVDTAGGTHIGDSPDDNITIGTNNTGGWSLTVSGSGSLTSGSYNIYTCGTTSTIAAGTDMYGIQATSSVSGVTVGSYYDNWGTTVVGTASTTAQTVLSKSSSNSAQQVGTFKVRAACDSQQEPGTYTDTLTLTATGSA